jgi:hypothetical protein
MKPLLLLIGFLFLPVQVNSFEKNANNITVMQINAKWNQHHNLDLKKLKNCKIQFAWLEDQPQSLKDKIKTVPVVMIFKNLNAVKQWNADLSFKLEVDLNEIQKTINSIQ